ncbi:MAG: tRNA (adenosine(37)-N6)-threonylcarbamoyltransferase complex dimerization subunit type 1 TsaB [Candidatus Omnitrophica bacterium]|nr:tRNA (adenosine(37)-N6)-threonylcarbamoyltransferase complex dimerization subunit type 1 TsaB [Candidatus Omnitrophota bacterium]
MKILAIETSSPLLGVAIVDEQAVLASYELLAERAHAAQLPVAVELVLRTAGLSLAKLDGVAIDIGPGSFTGLRIGVAFVKALLAGVPKPVIGIPSLDVLAANAAWATTRICPVLDARQRNVFAALYRGERGRAVKLSDYQLTTAQQLAQQLGPEPTLFLGDGLVRYRPILEEALGTRAVFTAPECWIPRPAVVGRLGLERLRAGHHDDPHRLSPLYLYPLDCTVRGPAAAAVSRS